MFSAVVSDNQQELPIIYARSMINWINSIWHTKLTICATKIMPKYEYSGAFEREAIEIEGIECAQQ